jgi:hypothetical protein
MTEIKELNKKNKEKEADLKEQEGTIHTQAEQIRRLATIIADADEELKVQTKQYNAVVNEQRVLSQQLVSRNEELARL